MKVRSVQLRDVRSQDVAAMAALMKTLPEWFTPEAVHDLRQGAAKLPGLVATDSAGEVAGFLLWEPQGSEWQIRWIAVAKGRHRQGIGKLLMTRALELARLGVVRRVRVATVAPTVDYEPYARTRAFYEAFGFSLEARLLQQPLG